MSASRAEDGAYLALADVATTAAATRTEYRVVGGHMVALHMARHPSAGLLARQTADADVGLEPLVLASSGMVDALYGMGYQLAAGNRFVREFEGLTLAIDMFVPADTSRVHHNRLVAGLFVDEVPGFGMRSHGRHCPPDCECGSRRDARSTSRPLFLTSFPRFA